MWYKYNDSTVTEDVRDSRAVLEELSDSGDPYYVAYVRDEMKHDLVDVPQRRKPDNDAVVRDDVEMQTIDGIDPGMKQSPLPQAAAQGSKVVEAAAVAAAAAVSVGDEPRPYELL